MMNKFYSSFFLWSFVLISCTQVSPLEQALQLSGKNRKQLERVLNNYSQCPGDSLKYRAACFLIENMAGHGWYEGNALDTYRRWVDSVYCDKDFVFKASLYEAFFQQPGATDDLTRYEDIENLDADFLITYIDSTFRAISVRPWLRSLTFDQLCQYVLPYRVGNERPQQLYKFQDSIFQTAVAGLLSYDDITTNVNAVFEYFPIYDRPVLKNIKILYRDRIVDYNLLGCVGLACRREWLAKLLLCPVVRDLNPAFPDRNDRHCWSVMVDNKQVNGISPLSFEISKQGKIYRYTFNSNPHPGNVTGEFIPPFFQSPFYQDITSSYTNSKDIQILPRIPVSTSYGYLCVFNNLKWEPVAYADFKEGQFNFKDMGRGVVYLPVVYPDENAIAVSYPFILESTGRVHTLQPDTTHLRTLKLIRKYPLKLNVSSANRAFVNSLVEASNDPLFRKKDSIGVFGSISNQQWSEILISSGREYRYWRIRSENFYVIAECLLVDKEGKLIQPVLRDQSEPLSYMNAFDDNPISYAYPDRNSIFQWDMGKKISLSGIKCLLRNDGNDIWPGHWYELYYHDGTGWCSLGLKEAFDRFIEYDDVPDNALLWLRDLTTGQQERIFTCHDGQIRFW